MGEENGSHIHGEKNIMTKWPRGGDICSWHQKCPQGHKTSRKKVPFYFGSFMRIKLLRDQRNHGTINLMRIYKNSSSKAPETVNMSLTPLTYRSKEGGSATDTHSTPFLAAELNIHHPEKKGPRELEVQQCHQSTCCGKQVWSQAELSKDELWWYKWG